MRHLRTLAVLLALAVVAQALFDRCLLVCHGAPRLDAGHCHDGTTTADDLRLADASSCSHGHGQWAVATTELGWQGPTSIAAAVPVAIAGMNAAPPRRRATAARASRVFLASSSAFLLPLRL